MHDQADQLRQLVRATLAADAALGPGGPVVAVSGSRPAAGATTAACGLARELARLGKQVILIDATIEHDVEHRNAPARETRPGADLARSALPQAQRAAQIHPTATITLSPHFSRHSATLADVLAGHRRAVEALTLTHEDGLRLLPGCPEDGAPPLDRRAVERLTAELAALSREAEVLVIDAGHGMNAWIDRLWQLARQVLVVATPDNQSFLDAYAAVKLAQHELLADKLRLVLNRTSDEDLPELNRRFQQTCQRFLSLTPKSAAALPPFQRPSTDLEAVAASRSFAGASDAAFARAVRLLAADLACDFRVSSLRLLRPSRPTHARAGQLID